MVNRNVYINFFNNKLIFDEIHEKLGMFKVSVF